MCKTDKIKVFIALEKTTHMSERVCGCSSLLISL